MAPHRAPLSQRLRRALERHFLFAPLAIAAVGGSSAEGAIIHGSLSGAVVPKNAADGLFLDLDTGSFGIGTRLAGYDLDLFDKVSGTSEVFGLRQAAGGAAVGYTIGVYTYGQKLALGQTIGGTATFVTYPILAAIDSAGNHGAFASGGAGLLLGFRFSAASNTLCYGWLRLSVQPNLVASGGNVATALEYAYDSTGAPIAAGVVPEAGPLSLLALGAVGVSLLRRRPETLP